nr:hypothetical protein [Burkholderia gladioli]
MNCKPGDLAYVVRARNAENVGAIVEVLHVAVHGVDFVSSSDAPGHVWMVRSRRLLARATANGRPLPPALERPFADACLRPIGGVPVTDEVEDEAPVEQPAAERLREYCRLFTSSSY